MKEELHIEILFTYMQPEFLRNSILSGENAIFNSKKMAPIVGSRGISEAGYLHCARSALVQRTTDELIQFYRELDQFMKEDATNSVFTLLADYAEKVLRFQSGEPFCRQEKLLEWRGQSFALGQNIFTCAGLAKKDIQDSCISENFSWPSMIKTDSSELQNLLLQGISENHFHLNGSTQIFSLSWGFLMNHPEGVEKYFQNAKFSENLKESYQWGIQDNMQSWAERIYDAAWIRSYLFRRCILGLEEEHLDDFVRFTCSLDKRKQIREIVEVLRFSYGVRFQQPNHEKKCLDYAITKKLAYVNNGANRFLAGERNFLYRCFRWSFQGRFSEKEQDLFYLYLLIKLRFREEMVQSNRRLGFRNFSDYQDRKAHGWGELKEYWMESYRLSVRETLEEPVQSLEMRIMPQNSKNQMKKTMKEMDQHIEFEFKDEEREEEKKLPEDKDYFYVFHFGKKQMVPIPADEKRHFFIYPRNWEVRKKVKKQAKAIKESLEDSGELCARIRGIDACSHEIACRPETFATAFRFLTDFCAEKSHLYDGVRCWPKLGKTYHVGEDFLELTDGLRAIDETICFLNLERGDRLGHALALGILPEKYYEKKEYSAVLPAQDILDNLTWVLYRSLEWGIAIPGELRNKLHDYAQSLLRYIYGKNCPQANLRDYFESWMLRGDDPEIYFEQEIDDAELVDKIKRKVGKYQISYIPYERYMMNSHLWDNFSIKSYREKPNVLRLLYSYHYGTEERIKGAEIKMFFIDEKYVKLIHNMQNCMMEKIMTKGIAIECNPSSNYLIGPINKYEEHPIFRFNSYGLDLPECESQSTQLKVSINTDDQGVFDTSLNNEYALLYACLQERKDKDGKRLISDDDAKAYLNHIRCLGNGMTFPKSEPKALGRIKEEGF